MQLVQDIHTREGELIKRLYNIVDNIVDSRHLESALLNMSGQFGLSIGTVSALLEKNLDLHSVDYIIIGKLGMLINELYKADIVDLGNYLTPIEIEEAKNKSIDIKTLKFPIKIENVLMLSHKRYLTALDARFLSELLQSGIVNYNFSTQREAKVIQTSLGDVKVPGVNWASVNEIADRILRGVFKENALTFNITSKLGKIPDYHFEEIITNVGNLVLKDCKLDIIDGYHRFLGVIQALSVNPDLDFKFEVRFADYSELEAGDFIVQEDKRNKIGVARIKELDSQDYIVYLIDKVRENNPELIATNKNLIAKGYGVLDLLTLYNAVQTYASINNRVDAVKLANKITKPINYSFEVMKALSEDYLTDQAVWSVILAKILTDKDEDLNFEDMLSFISRLVENKELLNKLKRLGGYEFFRKNSRGKRQAVESVLEVLNNEAS